MIKSRTALASNLFKLGILLMLVLVSLVFGLYGLHELGLVNVWVLPLKPVAAFVLGSGLVCLLASAVLGLKRRWLWRTVLIAFIGVNGLGYLGAYVLTHGKSPDQFGIGFPRPENASTPADFGMTYETQRVPMGAQHWLETWSIKSGRPQGTVLLFPGNKASKDKLLMPAQTFHQLGYDTWLVDFRGVGGSSGNTTTVGARESHDVAAAVEYARQQQMASPVILYGVSMGSVAALKAVGQGMVKPDAVILELPFARLLDSVKSRLQAMGIPTFPAGELIVFWGSLQHKFNGFTHNPVVYAKEVDCPTLVFHGQQDKWTTQAEIESIFNNLQGPKQLVVFPEAGHQLLVTVDKTRWRNSITQFLQTEVS